MTSPLSDLTEEYWPQWKNNRFRKHHAIPDSLPPVTVAFLATLKSTLRRILTLYELSFETGVKVQ